MIRTFLGIIIFITGITSSYLLGNAHLIYAFIAGVVGSVLFWRGLEAWWFKKSKI